MDRHTFWTAWLMVVSFTMAAFGVLMVLFNQTALFAGLLGEIQRAFSLPGDASAGLVQFQAWVYGVWGATVAGFGVLAAVVGGNAFARRERWARDALAGALALWYVLDTAASLASRVWVNAAFNTIVLAGFVLPLAFTWSHFVKRSTADRVPPA
jgi:hypothetical protein